MNHEQLYIELRTVLDHESGCWNWRLALDAGGYGKCNGGQSQLAHRTAYIAFVGPIPDGIQVRHLCHNRKCCNPVHLVLGTQTENIQDSIVSRRRLGAIPGAGVMDRETVLFIRFAHANMDLSYRQLAELLGVTPMTIYNVVKRRTWKEIV